MPDDPDGFIYFNIVILFIVFFLGALYSACESYLENISEKKLKKDASDGNKNAKILEEMIDRRRPMFTALRMGVKFYAMSFVALCAHLLFDRLTDILKTTRLGNFNLLPELFTLILLLFISVTIFFIFADFIPKKYVAHKAHVARYRFAKVILFLNNIILPWLLFSNFISNKFLLLFGMDPKNLDDTVTEDEIFQILDDGEEQGVIEEQEKDMIENILDFNDTTADEIMTHRIDISAVPDTATIQEIVSVSIEHGRSRIPVYHEDIDNIVGICYVRDLLPFVGKTLPSSSSIKNIIRQAYFVPESKKCNLLFSDMTEKRIQIAIVVDEYGGTSGLVTLEDLVESIFGNIQDEYDNEEEEIEIISDDEFTVDGGTDIDEIEDLTDVEFPEGDYDTIGGFVTDTLGRILKDDEHPTLEILGLEIKVIEVEDQRISKLSIKKIKQ